MPGLPNRMLSSKRTDIDADPQTRSTSALAAGRLSASAKTSGVTASALVGTRRMTWFSPMIPPCLAMNSEGTAAAFIDLLTGHIHALVKERHRRLPSPLVLVDKPEPRRRKRGGQSADHPSYHPQDEASRPSQSKSPPSALRLGEWSAPTRRQPPRLLPLLTRAAS
jgi:hypothetical protein